MCRLRHARFHNCTMYQVQSTFPLQLFLYKKTYLPKTRRLHKVGKNGILATPKRHIIFIPAPSNCTKGSKRRNFFGLNQSGEGHARRPGMQSAKISVFFCGNLREEDIFIKDHHEAGYANGDESDFARRFNLRESAYFFCVKLA